MKNSGGAKEKQNRGGGGGSDCISQEKIRVDTKHVKTALESIKNEYTNLQSKCNMSMKNNLRSEDDKLVAESKLTIIDKSLEKVTLGIEETDILLALSEYLQHLEVDKMRVRLQVKRLYQENEWLREELENLQNRLCKLDVELQAAEAEKQQFQYLYEMRKYDGEKEKQDEINDEDDEDDDGIPPRLRTLNNLLVQYVNQGRYEVAIPLCKQTLNDLRKEHGDKHPDVATMLCMMALVYRDQGDFKEAICLLEEALKIREELFGKEHACVAATLNNIAVLHVKRGKYKEAEPLCRRALAIRKKVLGNSHPDVAKQLNNLALLCQNLQKFDDVENLYREAIRVYQVKPEANEGNIIKTKNNLVSLYVKLQKFGEGEKILKEIINDWHAKSFGPPSANDPPYWMVVEEKAKTEPKKIRETADHLMSKFGRLSDPVMIVTVKNLSALYRKKNKNEAADMLETWVEASLKAASKDNYKSAPTGKPDTPTANSAPPPPANLDKRTLSKKKTGEDEKDKKGFFNKVFNKKDKKK